ncbi:MAG: ABC transporter ATP-binding protein [Anaerolineaceae bacterium]|nr:ABC transporter ATP-binding protein [Anaerolineaceae bacterium]
MRRGLSINERTSKARNPFKGLKRLLGYLKPFRLQLVVVFIFVLLATALNVVGPYLIGRVVDLALTPRDWDQLVRMTLLLLTNYLLMWLFSIIYGRIMAKTAQKAMQGMRQALFDHMQELSVSYYDKQTAGDLLSRLTNDMDAINSMLSQNLISFVQSLTMIIGVLAMMFILSWQLTLAALVVIPFSFIATATIMKRSGPAFRALQKSLGQMNGLLEEDLSGQRVVIAYGQQGSSLDDFEKYNQDVRDAGIKANVLAGLMPPITGILNNLDVIVVVAAGAVMLINGIGGITVGLITSFSEYTRRFGRPINQIANLFNSMMAALAGAERIFEVLDFRPAIEDTPDAMSLDTIQGEVQFEDVSFGYNEDHPVLKHISLEAKPGKTIALVGPTGAGKTTIINLLTRFYDINSGKILIDGYDIRDVRQDDLRRKLGIVLQDTYLFAESVMENIRYGRLDATEDEIMEAARLANANGFIQRLPEGYYTELSEGGTNLSEGQRQLLAIARAILADPAILILDEATSSVDTRTEVEIQAALLKLMEGRTSFVIAHRLSTIRNADQILVINDGELIERGTHESLLAEKGFYYNLYTSQFKGMPMAA